MNTMSEASAGAGTPLKKLELALEQEVACGKSKKDADFKEAYPLLEQYLARKMSQKVVLGKFNAAYDYKLHPPGFRKMLEAERKRRSESGEDPACRECGQRLHAVIDVNSDDSETAE